MRSGPRTWKGALQEGSGKPAPAQFSREIGQRAGDAAPEHVDRDPVLDLGARSAERLVAQK